MKSTKKTIISIILGLTIFMILDLFYICLNFTPMANNYSIFFVILFSRNSIQFNICYIKKIINCFKIWLYLSVYNCNYKPNQNKDYK